MTRARDIADVQDNLGGAVAPYVAGKNKISNGSMLIAQRGTSFAGISGTTDTYTLDRWMVRPQNLGTVTATQDSTVPSGAGVGQSIKLACTTADAAPAAGTRLRIIQRIEGIECQDFGFGFASAKNITLSFWVRSSKTGTYVVELWTFQTGGATSKNISASYTISTANTWQQVKITFPGDTASEIRNTTDSGLEVYFYLAAGSDYTSGTLNTSWNEPVTANRAVGQVNWADSNTATFYMTAVQLEIGSVATPFSRAGGSIGGELALCQRYYYRMGGLSTYQRFGAGTARSTTAGEINTIFPVTMRVKPTSIDFSTLTLDDTFTTVSSVTNAVIDSAGSGNNQVTTTCTSSGLTQGRFYNLEANNSTSGYLGFSAEL